MTGLEARRTISLAVGVLMFTCIVLMSLLKRAREERFSFGRICWRKSGRYHGDYGGWDNIKSCKRYKKNKKPITGANPGHRSSVLFLTYFSVSKVLEIPSPTHLLAPC